MLYAPLQATWDTRDDVLNAREGFYLDTDLTPFLGFEETDDGLYLYGDGRAYRTFGEARPITLAGRMQVGSIMGARLDRVPNDMRFYSGGGGTVRGQDYQSLGITLDGRDSGGASLFVLSAEARAVVTDSIGVVAFADYGVVGADPFPGGLGQQSFRRRGSACAISPRSARSASMSPSRSREIPRPTTTTSTSA
jgi:translocation and assembly module TamA